MDCIVHGVTKSWTWLSDFHFTFSRVVLNFPTGRRHNTVGRGNWMVFGEGMLSSQSDGEGFWHHFCCSVAQSCPTLCSPMDCNTPGFPVLHHLLEFAQTHVRWLCDPTISSSVTPFSPAFNLSQHHHLFKKYREVRRSSIWEKLDAFYSFSPSFFYWIRENMPRTRAAGLLEDFVVKSGRQTVEGTSTQICKYGIVLCSRHARGCCVSHESEGGQTQCSLQHYLQQHRHRSNLNVHQQMNGLKCGTVKYLCHLQQHGCTCRLSYWAK